MTAPGIYWALEGDKRVPLEWTGKEWWGIGMQRPHSQDEVVDPLPALDLQEAKRLDWLLSNQGAQCHRFSNGDYYIQTWVCHSEPGNLNGSGGQFIAHGSSHRECIDKFLSGDIKRVD